MEDNTKKNTGVRSNGFDKRPQPTPQAKSAGWERRKHAQAMMDKIKQYMDMNHSDFLALLKDIQDNPDKHTVQDFLLYKYAEKAFKGDQFMLDWMDRNISKAPIETKNDTIVNWDLKKILNDIDGKTKKLD